MSNITPDILKKYAQSNCSDSERAAVQEWLSGSRIPEGLPPAGAEDHRVKEAMWQRIKDATLLKRRSLTRVIIRKAAWPVAACLFLAVAGSFSRSLNIFGRHVRIDNIGGGTLKEAIVGNLVFIVQPGGSCDVQIPLWGSDGEVQFSGAVSVANRSSGSSSFRINTGTLAGKFSYADHVILRKGQTYLAMTDDHYNVITATTDELEDGLPKPFSARLHKRFNL